MGKEFVCECGEEFDCIYEFANHCTFGHDEDGDEE